jgi:hypothetical protein
MPKNHFAKPLLFLCSLRSFVVKKLSTFRGSAGVSPSILHQMILRASSAELGTVENVSFIIFRYG